MWCRATGTSQRVRGHTLGIDGDRQERRSGSVTQSAAAESRKTRMQPQSRFTTLLPVLIHALHQMASKGASVQPPLAS